jgi:hypothetical protein
MNTLEMFVRQGELTYELSRGLCHCIVNSRREPWQGPRYFVDACDLLNCIRGFIENERTLFVEALANAGEQMSLAQKIDSSAHSIGARLDDLVMMHVDEPDGSFARGIAELVQSFESLVRLMRESLQVMRVEGVESLDLRHLQVLLRRAA